MPQSPRKASAAASDAGITAALRAGHETSELVVSFLAEDSTDGHVSTAYSWKNRITLKHRVYQAGADKMLELSAAPEAPMRYSTDGSNPMIAGATY